MATVTMGIGSSHTPMLSTPVDEFEGHARRDAENADVDDFPGRSRRLGPRLADELTADVARDRDAACQEAIAVLHEALRSHDPDVLVVVGDDQEEWFDRENIPAVAIYWNDTVETQPPPVEARHPTLRSSYWGHYGDGSNLTAPVAGDLGRHVIEQLTEREFDVYSFRAQPEGEPFGHAWGFVYHRLLEHEAKIPVLPVLLNTYYPPNTPTPGRCLDLGRALREAIEAWPEDLRVAVIASGGMSHFVLDEDLDRRVLEALETRDEAAMRSLPVDRMTSGTSEIRNWLVAAGATEHLQMKLVDYVPYVRSEAGTGVGMGFALWL